MKSTKKTTKSYAEIEATYLDKIEKLNQKKFNFEAKQEKDKIKFLEKLEAEELKINEEFEAAKAECSDTPPPFGVMVQTDPTYIGDYSS